MPRIDMRTVRKQVVEAGLRLEGDETDDDIFEAWQNIQKRKSER
jgi:hypothetical protein